MEVYANNWDLLITKLQQLGFSPNSARVYLAIVGGRPMNGSEIARALGINRSLIYKALEELSCKGAIAGLPVASTTRYTALPLEEILDSMKKDFESTCEFLRNQLGEAIQVPEMKNIWNVSGYGSIVRRASRMMQKAVTISKGGKG
ncbi:MAG: hypothetical protein M1379_08450 [Firmicutes bacterium]|nr:hypothetical protein [Bacillota bacterium]